MGVLTPMNLDVNNRFQILSLDGGGIKGLFSAAILAAIEEDLNIDVTEHFDLIAGTSTGGLIAIGLGLGLRPREIVELYLREGASIFPRWLGLRSLLHWMYRKFSSLPLEKALQRCFRDKRFGDSKKRLVIPSYNIGADDIYIFRTAHHEGLRRDYKVPAWKVAQATSAAPTYFPSVRTIDSTRLIDGGVWANNPTMVALVEAYGVLNIPLNQIAILSVGTSKAVTSRKANLNNGGILSWASSGAIVDVIMSGQSQGVINQAKFLLGEERFERLDPVVAPNEFSLDGIHKANDLIGRASHHSRIFVPQFQKKFGDHLCPKFIPFFI
jgi:patatin-like phospholipase/acyl hydrolase